MNCNQHILFIIYCDSINKALLCFYYIFRTAHNECSNWTVWSSNPGTKGDKCTLVWRNCAPQASLRAPLASYTEIQRPISKSQQKCVRSYHWVVKSAKWHIVYCTQFNSEQCNSMNHRQHKLQKSSPIFSHSFFVPLSGNLNGFEKIKAPFRVMLESQSRFF